MGHKFERYCKDYENIENYEAAKKDNFIGWDCHHRLQTWTSDGERRLVDITAAELKALGMYYNRPADELIFLPESEHNNLHKKGNTYRLGKPHTEESRIKMSKAHKGKQAGENNPMYGKHHTEEARNKMSEAHKGKSLSEEHKKKLSEAHKGRQFSKETRYKLSIVKKGNTATKGMHWYNNGKINKVCYECPDGFTPGRLRK